MFKWLAICLSCVSPFLYAEKPIVVLTTSYNNRRWVQQNILSILRQEYSNYRLIYIDDASRDGTPHVVEKFLRKRARFGCPFQLIKNTERKGALANIYYAIHELCKEDEIIVSLDGDDWFYDTQVLKKIDQLYSSQEVWLTHGSFLEFPSNEQGWSIPIPQDIID